MKRKKIINASKTVYYSSDTQSVNYLLQMEQVWKKK